VAARGVPLGGGLVASKTGTAVGTAIATMEMADRLGDLPVVAAAFRAGLLSEAQAREIAEVATEVPDAQEQLVEAAGKLTLRSLQEECRKDLSALRKVIISARRC